MLFTVTDIVDRPGRSREVNKVIPATELMELGDWGPVEGHLASDVTLDLTFDSVVEGILVRGTVSWALDIPCHRCLEDQHLEQNVDVTELFANPAKLESADDLEEGYQLIDDATALDLEILLRDTIVLAFPIKTPDHACQGPAGSDHPIIDDDVKLPDPRWAALASIEVPPSAN